MRVKYLGKAKTVALEKDKEYEVISIEKGWYRIMTELDEDYLFPPQLFEIVEYDFSKGEKNPYSNIYNIIYFLIEYLIERQERHIKGLNPDMALFLFGGEADD